MFMEEQNYSNSLILILLLLSTYCMPVFPSNKSSLQSWIKKISENIGISTSGTKCLNAQHQCCRVLGNYYVIVSEVLFIGDTQRTAMVDSYYIYKSLFLSVKKASENLARTLPAMPTSCMSQMYTTFSLEFWQVLRNMQNLKPRQ